MLEVMQEEELEAMRQHQLQYEQRRKEELMETQRLEAAEQRRYDEKERRKKQEVERLRKEKETREKLASRLYATQVSFLFFANPQWPSPRVNLLVPWLSQLTVQETSPTVVAVEYQPRMWVHDIALLPSNTTPTPGPGHSG